MGGRIQRVLAVSCALTFVTGIAPAAGRPTMFVSSLADSATTFPGGSIGFTISISNAGPGTARSVTLNDALSPAGTVWVESPDVAACSVGGPSGSQVLFCDFGSVREGETVLVHVTSFAEGPCGLVVGNFPIVNSRNGTVEIATLQTITIGCAAGPAYATVFEDKNANSVRDGGEPGLAGWEIHVIGSDGSHSHAPTAPDGFAFIQLQTGIDYLICETLIGGWTQTAPVTGPDCTGHAHAGAPGPHGFMVTPEQFGPLEFGNIRSCIGDPVSKGGYAYGMRGNFLGGGLLPADPDIGPMPDSHSTNPDRLLTIPNIFDGTPLASTLAVSEEETAGSVTATAETGVIDLNIPGLSEWRIRADKVIARSTSYVERGGASSGSSGSKISNLRIGAVQYGDVSGPLTVVFDDPFRPGTPFIEVRLLERIRRHAAAGVVQTAADRLSRSGLEVNGIHVIVHDLAATSGIDESSDIFIAHAETDLVLRAFCRLPSVAGQSLPVRIEDHGPAPIDVIPGIALLPSTGGLEEHAWSVDVPGLLAAEAAVATTRGDVSRVSPDTAEVSSRALLEDLDLNTIATATAIQTTASASCESPSSAPTSCSSVLLGGETTLDHLTIFGLDVCRTLGLSPPCTVPPNTGFDIPGVLKVILNEQTIDGDGRGLSVNGVHIWVLAVGEARQPRMGTEIVLGSSYAATKAR